LAGVLLKLGGYGLLRVFPVLFKFGFGFSVVWISLSLVGKNDQLDALFLNVFISCLCMFRATSAHHQEGQLILIHHLV
jgi:hypothetical protein